LVFLLAKYVEGLADYDERFDGVKEWNEYIYACVDKCYKTITKFQKEQAEAWAKEKKVLRAKRRTRREQKKSRKQAQKATKQAVQALE
jgi:hypothetical protein